MTYANRAWYVCNDCGYDMYGRPGGDYLCPHCDVAMDETPEPGSDSAEE